MSPNGRFPLRRWAAIWLLSLGMLGLTTAPLAREAPSAGQPMVLMIEVEGPINPAVLDYLQSGLNEARKRGADALLIRLNTPGGLLESTRSIVEEMLSAPLPILVWVGPSGARAASAGMFITLAAHVAAMAPGTNIGAATPVSGQGQDVEEQGGGDLKRKVMEDTRAFARSIANVRDRPIDWMERAVTDAVSATAAEALDMGVIDLVAPDVGMLLGAAHGIEVEIRGETRTLRLADAHIERLEMGPGQKLMHWLAHPNVAYLLFLLGIIGIYLEVSNPGSLLPGTLGALSIVLAFISMQVLPFRAGGLALILLAVGLFVAEAFVPSFGILTAGGLAAFVIGSLILFDSPGSDLDLDRGLIYGAAAGFAVSMVAIGTLIVRTHRRPTVSGASAMAGETAEALTDLDPKGKVFVHGEIWSARVIDGSSVPKGSEVRVNRVEGMTVVVEPLPATETEREA